MTTRERIDDFLSQKRIAMVGVSRNWKDFSRVLFRDLKKHGYDMVPVHPEADEIEELKCFSQLQDVSPPVDGVLLMTKPEVTDAVVKDCVGSGVRRIWMYRAAGPGAVSQSAVDMCEEEGITVVPGYCPYMFLNNAGFIHKVHGFLFKLFGKYPQ